MRGVLSCDSLLPDLAPTSRTSRGEVILPQKGSGMKTSAHRCSPGCKSLGVGTKRLIPLIPRLVQATAEDSAETRKLQSAGSSLTMVPQERYGSMLHEQPGAASPWSQSFNVNGFLLFLFARPRGVDRNIIRNVPSWSVFLVDLLLLFLVFP